MPKFSLHGNSGARTFAGAGRFLFEKKNFSTEQT